MGPSHRHPDLVRPPAPPLPGPRAPLGPHQHKWRRWREEDWPEDTWAAYQIELQGVGATLFVPRDDEEMLRAPPGADSEAAKRWRGVRIFGNRASPANQLPEEEEEIRRGDHHQKEWSGGQAVTVDGLRIRAMSEAQRLDEEEAGEGGEGALRALSEHVRETVQPDLVRSATLTSCRPAASLSLSL